MLIIELKINRINRLIRIKLEFLVTINPKVVISRHATIKQDKTRIQDQRASLCRLSSYFCNHCTDSS